MTDAEKNIVKKEIIRTYESAFNIMKRNNVAQPHYVYFNDFACALFGIKNEPITYEKLMQLKKSMSD